MQIWGPGCLLIDTFGLPTRHRDFHRQNKRNPARCQRMTVSGLTITKAFRTSGAIL